MKASDARHPVRRRRRLASRLRRSLLCAVLTAPLPGVAAAVEVDFQTGLAVLHSDNINLDANPQSETVFSPRLTFQAVQTGTQVELKATGTLEYLHFVQNTFGDEARGELAGQLRWTISPERLALVVEDYLSQQPVDVTSGFSPSNRQQVNVFIAGPSVFARLSEVTRAQVDLRFSNTYAQDTKEFNGDRYNGAVRVVRELSSRSQVSANVEATEARFDRPELSTDYTRQDAYVGFKRVLARSESTLSLGYSRLRLDSGDRWYSSPLARASFTWRASTRNAFGILGAFEFSDAAADLVSNLQQGRPLTLDSVGSPGLTVSPDVYRRRHLELSYTYTGPLLTASLRPFTDRLDYLSDRVSDRDNRGVSADLDYRISERLRLAASALDYRQSYASLSRTDRDRTLRVGIIDQLSRHWTARVDLQRRTRDSTFAGGDYSENLVIASISYRR